MLGERDPATQQKGAQTIGQTGLPELPFQGLAGAFWLGIGARVSQNAMKPGASPEVHA
jgi:hypothetical protein